MKTSLRALRPSRVAAAGVLAAAAFGLTACAPASTDDVVTGSGGGATAAPAEGTSLADVQEAGELVVGTEGTYKPFSFHEGGSGDLTGYDVEVVTAVAEKLGVEPRFEETQWDAMFAGLDAARFDLIANQVSINAERQARYSLSEPYTVSRGVVLVPAATTDVASLADLDGKTTAQSQSSNWYQIARDAGADVEVVEGWSETIALLEQGRVDATVNDELTWLDYAQTEPEKSQAVKQAVTTDDVSESAFVVRQGSDDLLAAVDAALDELRADGTLASISEKYFGQDVSQ